MIIMTGVRERKSAIQPRELRTQSTETKPTQWRVRRLLALRAEKKGYVRAAPILAAAPCLGYWWECLQEARVLGLRPAGRASLLTGLALSGARQL